jgi:hypothetical protein
MHVNGAPEPPGSSSAPTSPERPPEGQAAEPAPTPQDDAIRAVIRRLARAHPSGGRVVERASLLAAGADFRVLMAWIEAHDGKPEALVSRTRTDHGVHGARSDAGRGQDATPLRFVLPAETLR